MEEPPQRPRRRRSGDGLERPISGRLYRAAWAAVLVPVLVTAFTVGQPSPLPAPELPASFDQGTAVRLAAELAERFPDRRPSTTGARGAAAWVEQHLGDFGLPPARATFTAEVPGLGELTFANVFAVVPGASPQAIVVMAHRDNLGLSPGANDDASGTAALIELARNVVTPTEGRQVALEHTLVFLSTDGDAYGALGAAELARDPGPVLRLIGPGASIVAVVNLDAIAGEGPPRLEFAGDTPRSASPAFLRTVDERVRKQSGSLPSRPSVVGQLIDLAFPFSLFGHAPLVAHGIPAVTLTSGDGRPPPPAGDTAAALRRGQLGTIGRATQGLLASLDQTADAARGTGSYLYLGSRIVRGWGIESVLLASLLPFFVSTLELFARLRRLRVPLAPALRSLRSRLAIWLWGGGVFALLALLGALPRGEARPLAPDTAAAGHWPVGALSLVGLLAALSWLLARPRLVPRRPLEREEELAGHLAALLGLGGAALLVAATNPFALVLVLPSLHAWLWLPQLEAGIGARAALYLAGLAGPALLLVSFAVRFDLGLDAPWYVLALAAVGYVPVSLGIAFLVWGAAGAQLAALAGGRYGPYPRGSERPRLGPIRSAIRRLELARQARRRDLRER